MSFNPHTHAGCDKDSTYNFEQAFDVSIHTPTQGVTKLDISNVPTENVSIHTPTQGVTAAWAISSGAGSFNPHTHAGCDSISKDVYKRQRLHPSSIRHGHQC